MKYTLNTTTQYKPSSLMSTIKKFVPLLAKDKNNLLVAMIALLINSLTNLAAPILLGVAIDKYIQTKQYPGVLFISGILLIIYLVGLLASYIQTKTMGTVGQRLLFNLRTTVFLKLQELPVAFFNQNKAGDLISRINNDTDKLNQFFSQSLMQFVGSVFMMTGAAIFILFINFRLGIVTLLPAVVVLFFTQFISGWVKRKNTSNLQAVGGMSAEISESLQNFKVIVAYNRRDYFRKRFQSVNQTNFTSAVSAGIANNIFTPVYTLASVIAQVVVLFYGIYLITQGNFTVGLLISFLTYSSRFYDPIRQLAALWSTFQIALAGWDRISEILVLQSDMQVVTAPSKKEASSVLAFDKVSFNYVEGKDVLHEISFQLDKGKTYAFVGPTGGGKTTTASLMARLYDPAKGKVLLDGQDIRSYPSGDRTKKIGFILQEPYLFTGTVRENILYGNVEYADHSNKDLAEVFKKLHLEDLLSRFDKGLDTPVATNGETISLGQRQLIAFIRAVLRRPELLILDEATANIDTVTEKLLDEILEKLPKETTKVVIAHRLNTIENADEIFFVNAGEITRAGSLKHAMELLLEGKRES